MYRMIDGELTAWKCLAMERCENDTKSVFNIAHRCPMLIFQLYFVAPEHAMQVSLMQS